MIPLEQAFAVVELLDVRELDDCGRGCLSETDSDSSGGKHLAGIGVVKIATVCCWLWLVPQH
jgi:hypothetical protein